MRDEHEPRRRRRACSSATRSYSIAVGSNLLGATASYQELPRGSSAVIVSNETVAPLYGDRLAAALAPLYPKVDIVSLPDGEAHKTWQTLQTIFDAMLAAHCDRSTTVFALGGGVVGDLAGFAAACYMRGVAYVQVPTTLLAQVDSSVGGKTGVNHPSGKNMIGAFHQPLAVVADVDVLDTLPERELVAGLAEVIKYGAVADDAFLAWIEASLPALLARDKAALVAGGDALLPHQGTGRRERRARVRAARDPQLRPHLRPRDRDRHRPRHLAARRGGRLRHGDGGRPLRAPRLDRARACCAHRVASSPLPACRCARRRSASRATSS